MKSLNLSKVRRGSGSSRRYFFSAPATVWGSRSPDSSRSIPASNDAYRGNGCNKLYLLSIMFVKVNIKVKYSFKKYCSNILVQYCISITKNNNKQNIHTFSLFTFEAMPAIRNSPCKSNQKYMKRLLSSQTTAL